MYSETNGDLFEAKVDAIGHGCNCVGAMGAGIALQFRKHWPEMYWIYNDLCKKKIFKLGGAMYWQDPRSGTWIYNLATQEFPGANAELSAIEKSLRVMLSHAQANDIMTIGLPRIGSGIGGLEWGDVRDVIKQQADKSPVTITVYSL